MRKAFERVTQRLQAFIAQRDDLALVLTSPGAQSALLLKILESLQENSSSELFWIFSAPFAGPGEFVAAAVEDFAARHQAVRLLQEKEGMAVWPELPRTLRDPRRRPAERLRELMVFGRSLLPAPEGMLVVWGLFPLEIADPAGYAALARDVLQHEFPFPWCHHMRIILRDDPACPALGPALGQPPRVAWYAPDLSPQALEQALDEEAADEDLPLEQRLQAVLVSAGCDYAHRRYDRALDKYRLLFPYFAGKGNLALSALVLNGMGEVHLAQGNQDEAAECFLAAVVPAADGAAPPLPVLTNVVLNLARLRTSQRKWADAASYWNELQKLAAAQRNPPLKVFALEQLGQARYEQGEVAAALEAWQAGETAAEKLELPRQRRNILERLRGHYQRAGDAVQCRSVEQKLEAAARAAAAGS